MRVSKIKWHLRKSDRAARAAKQVGDDLLQTRVGAVVPAPVAPRQHVARWQAHALSAEDGGGVEHVVSVRTGIDRGGRRRRSHASRPCRPLANDLQAGQAPL